jgi:hypothetical protein
MSSTAGARPRRRPPAAEYDAENHIYYDDAGGVIPGVTTILRYLTPTYLNKEAADRGTFIHEATALDDEEDLYWDGVPEEFTGYLFAWRAFREKAGFTPIREYTELRVDHPRWRYAGRIDRGGTFGDDFPLWVLDIKTGARERWHRLQTAAYADALDAMGHPVAGRACVYLDADGSYNIALHPTDWRRDMRVFLHCLGLYNWEENPDAHR